MNRDYHLGLLYFVHLLIDADGVMDERELEALKIVREREMIPGPVVEEFERNVRRKSEHDIYRTGLEFIDRCSHQEKLSIFSTLYKLSEVDGRVHTKEIRLLLYSLRDAGMNFDEVVNSTRRTPSIL